MYQSQEVRLRLTSDTAPTVAHYHKSGAGCDEEILCITNYNLCVININRLHNMHTRWCPVRVHTLKMGSPNQEQSARAFWGHLLLLDKIIINGRLIACSDHIHSSSVYMPYAATFPTDNSHGQSPCPQLLVPNRPEKLIITTTTTTTKLHSRVRRLCNPWIIAFGNVLVAQFHRCSLARVLNLSIHPVECARGDIQCTFIFPFRSRERRRDSSKDSVITIFIVIASPPIPNTVPSRACCCILAAACPNIVLWPLRKENVQTEISFPKVQQQPNCLRSCRTITMCDTETGRARWLPELELLVELLI